MMATTDNAKWHFSYSVSLGVYYSYVKPRGWVSSIKGEKMARESTSPQSE